MRYSHWSVTRTGKGNIWITGKWIQSVERKSKQHTKNTGTEVDITGEKGEEIEDHNGLELVEDNKERHENKEKETEHVLQA